VRKIKTAQFGILNGMLQLLVLKLGHLSALGAYLVMVRIAIITFFVLGRVAELMLDDQTSIYKQNDGIVKRCTADAEVLLVGHQ
jgi:hypothetical protein